MPRSFSPGLAALLALLALAALPARAGAQPEVDREALIRRAAATGPAREVLRHHPDATPEVLRDERLDRWIVAWRYTPPGHRDDLPRAVGAVVHFDADGRELVDAVLDPELEFAIRPTLHELAAAALALALMLWLFGPRWEAALLLGIAPFLAMPSFDHHLARLVHTGIWLVTLAFFARALAATRQSPHAPVAPRPPWLLGAMLVAALAYHVYLLRIGVSEDSGIWGCFGAQHLLQHGQWPYGQPHFFGVDSYGPLFYVLLAPLVWLLPPGYESADGFVPLVEQVPPTFERLTFAASQVLVGAADLAIVAGLIVAGQRLRRGSDGLRLGLALALTYAVIPYTLIELIHPSRSVPTAFVLWALIWADRPARAGGMLACATATIMFPVVLIPLWLARYRGADRWRFLAPVLVMGALCLIAIHIGDSNWQRFYTSTWINQEGIERYGSSDYGFWGQNDAPRLLKLCLRVLHLAGCAALLFLPRPPTRYQLACWTAAVLTGIQLWKTHGGGSYISWHLPFLLLAVLPAGEQPAPGATRQRETPETQETRETRDER